MQVLYDAGYQDFESRAPTTKYSYSFSGLSGSLDHVLGNAGAVARFTGADIWNINSVESIAMEYSRFNNHATDFHTDTPFRGLRPRPGGRRASTPRPRPTLDIQILGTNDFHGRHRQRRHAAPRPVPRCWRARSSSCARRTPTRCSRPPVT